MLRDSRVRRWMLVATLVVLASPVLAQEKKPDAAKPKDIIAVAKEADNLKTFCKLVQLAGLEETLKAKGPYTVFAPTDEAFKKLGKDLERLQKPENKEELQRVLKHHVLEGRTPVADLKAMKKAKPLAGEELKIAAKDDMVTVNAAKVTKSDVESSNGLIHAIDAVLVLAEEPGEES